MQRETLLELGCDGGSIKLQRVVIHGTFLFKIHKGEVFETSISKLATYICLKDAWESLKLICPSWYELYLVGISAQIIDLVKSDYIYVTNKNEFTKDRWLEQLIGYGLDF